MGKLQKCKLSLSKLKIIYHLKCSVLLKVTLKKTLGDKENSSMTCIDRGCDNMKHKLIVKP